MPKFSLKTINDIDKETAEAGGTPTEDGGHPAEVSNNKDSLVLRSSF